MWLGYHMCFHFFWRLYLQSTSQIDASCFWFFVFRTWIWESGIRDLNLGHGSRIVFLVVFFVFGAFFPTSVRAWSICCTGFFSRREVLDLGTKEEGVFLKHWWTDGSRDEAAAGEAGSDHDLGCPHGCIQAHRQQMRSSEPSLSGLQAEWPQPREMFASGPGRHKLCCLVVSFVNLSQSRVVYDRAFTYYTRFSCSFHVSSPACKAIKKCGR
jgi:hypothetical protein